MSIRPTIGVGVLIWRQQQLLLGKRLIDNQAEKQTTCWQFPGGHLENNETVIECAVREVREETSLQVQALRHLGYTNKTFTIGQQPYITLLVSCKYQSGVAQTLEPDKCERWQWFDYQKLPAPLFEPISLFMSQCDDLYAQHCASPVVTAQ
jgi:8-oxo-dGTP diphosphatase